MSDGTMTKDYMKHITIDPSIMMGKPVIAGTRIPVEIILRYLGEGMTPEELLNEYPQLTIQDIQAAQAWAADYLADEDVYALHE